MSNETTQDELRANVERGIAWLDENEPDWRDVIEHHGWDRLDMQDCWACIFGDLYNHYDTGVSINNLSREQSASLGLIILDPIEGRLSDYELSEQYDALTELWQELGPKKAVPL